MNIIRWLKSLIFKDKYVELPTTVNQNDLNIKQKNRKVEITNNSLLNITKLEKLKELSKNTIYSEQFSKVLELTNTIHKKIIEDEKISINKLEQFHMYYTTEFLNTYEEALYELIPKKSSINTINHPLNWRNGIWNDKIRMVNSNSYQDKRATYYDDKYESLQDRLKRLNHVKASNKAYDKIDHSLYIDLVNNLYKHSLPEIIIHDEMFEYYDDSKGQQFRNYYSEFLVSTFKLRDKVTSYLYLGDLNDKINSPVLYNDYNMTYYILNLKTHTIKELMR